jgi:hypothetical protein
LGCVSLRSCADNVEFNQFFFCSSSLSSAHYSPLLNIGLSNLSPSRSILGYSHPAPVSRPAPIVTPPGLMASCTMFTEMRSPLQNSFTPAVVGSTADMATPLPRCAMSVTLCSDSIPQRNPEHFHSCCATLNLWTSRAVTAFFLFSM